MYINDIKDIIFKYLSFINQQYCTDFILIYIYIFLCYRSIEHVLCESKQPLTSSNLKISKELSIRSIENKENNILNMLKKLPDITFDYVKSDQIFKVPKIPKYIKNYPKKINDSEVNLKKIGLSKKSKNIKKDRNSVLCHFKKINSNIKKTWNENLKQIDNNDQLITNNVDNIKTQKKTEATSNAFYIKKNLQKTSSPYNRSKDTCNASCKVKTISDDDLNVDNIPIKTNVPVPNKECTLLDSDLSIEGHIVPEILPLPSDFINTSIPEYDSFLMGIISSPQDSSTRSSIMCTETFQNEVEKGIESSNGQEETTNYTRFAWNLINE